MARIVIPEMLKLGYDKRFAAGVVAAGGTLASLIPPPSAILVIYAIIVEQDVCMLLMAGFLPGAVSTIIVLNGGAEVAAVDSAFGVSGLGCSIWFGIIVVKMAELCLITPPIGLNCFVVAGVRPECSVQDIFRGATPFFVADVITIAVLIMFPAIVLWFPSLLF